MCSFTTKHGYSTVFWHFKEQDNIAPKSFDANVGFWIRCGNFSFAEIPRDYARILGVTGTLTSLGPFERNIIEDEYKIQLSTVMPSIYG